MSRKRIIIISGVTGAIGSALLAEYAKDADNSIYGISRQGRPVSDFLNNGKLPHKTLICSIGDLLDYSSLFEHIDYSVDEVIYIHALGVYPFEIDQDGVLEVQDDNDADGISDEVTRQTYNAFTSATDQLLKYWHGEVSCVIFGGNADKHHPIILQSWWKTMEKVTRYLKEKVSKNPKMSGFLVNISSVLCPHEIITRPYVFINTDADQRYWLSPYDLAKFVVSEIAKKDSGFFELEKFNKRPGFCPERYYTDVQMIPRRLNELYKCTKA